MKKLLLAACIAFAGITAHAQTTTIGYSSTATMPLGFYALGNNAPTPVCATVLSTGLYPMAPAPATLVGSAAVPVGINNIAELVVDVDMGGGTHYGQMLSLCGAAVSTNNPISWGPGGTAFSCYYDITYVSTGFISLNFHM